MGSEMCIRDRGHRKKHRPKGKRFRPRRNPEPETQSSHVSSEEEDEQTETEAVDTQSGPTDIEDLGSDTSEKEETEEFYTPGTTVKAKGFFDNLIADRKLMNEAAHLAKGDYQEEKKILEKLREENRKKKDEEERLEKKEREREQKNQLRKTLEAIEEQEKEKMFQRRERQRRQE